MVADCDLGFETRVDPWPLSVNGEAVGVVLGRRLLELARASGVWAISSRHPGRSAARLSGAPDPTGFHSPVLAVLAAHECDVPLPSEPGPDAVTLTDPIAKARLIDPHAEPGF